MSRVAVFALVALLALNARAQNPNPAQVWYNGSHIELKVIDAGAGLAAEWRFDRANNGDVRLIKDERRGSARVSGTLMSVCGDQALLFKDIVPARMHELQELNEPVLHLQLVLRLLARAMPQGLPAAGTQTAIDAAEDKNALRVRKAYRARKDFGAPWRVRGVANRRATGEVAFDMVLTFTPENASGKPAEIKLTGVWEQQSRMPVVDNAFDLRDWRVHRVDPFAEVVAGFTHVEFEAKTAPLKFANMGEVRAAIERSWDPNIKASRRSVCSS
ncbi:MAG: hypothetical protein ABIS45_06895 [Burkholderiales bacterium]